jgi:hypothetical protein
MDSNMQHRDSLRYAIPVPGPDLAARYLLESMDSHCQEYRSTFDASAAGVRDVIRDYIALKFSEVPVEKKFRQGIINKKHTQ